LDDTQAAGGAAARGGPEDRLDSWKKIASYLKRDVSTVQRWERREAMPVHRHLHDKLGSVFAFRSELDAWWEGRRTRLAQEDAAPVVQPTPSLQPSATTRSGAMPIPACLLRWGAVAVAVVLAAALAWVATERSHSWRSPLASARFTRLAEFAGTERSAAISPDGKYIALIAQQNGQTDAWLSVVGSGTYRNLTGGAVGDLVNPSVRVLGFSADSSLVSMWTRRPDGSQPGDVRLVAAPTAGGPLRPYLRDVAEFDWSADGRRLVYHTTAPGDPLFVREMGARGEAVERMIYVAPAGVHCHFPLWSSDGAFVYFVRGVPPDDWDIWRIQRSGSGLERMTTHSARVAYPVMLDRSTLLYLAGDADGSGPWIYALDLARGIAHRISSGLESYTSLAASADGRRLVATVSNPHTSLWRVPLTADQARNEPTLLQANGATPRFGPDFVLFISSAGARQSIWRLMHDSKLELWSSAHARIVGAPAVAPDGRRIAFTVEDDGKTRLYVADSDGSHLRVLADSLVLRGSPAWAPDGQSLVSAAIREGAPHLTRISLKGDSPPATLVSEYSLDPVWSPDGRFVAYSGADVGTTFPLRAAASDGRPFAVPSLMLTRGARRVVFLRNQPALIFLRGEIGHKDLWMLDLQSGDQRLLSVLPPDFTVRDFDVSADGTEIVFDRVQENSDLALIERKP